MRQRDARPSTTTRCNTVSRHAARRSAGAAVIVTRSIADRERGRGVDADVPRALVRTPLLRLRLPRRAVNPTNDVALSAARRIFSIH